ncbi:virulence factor [Janthinobacterium sp. PAMC25594]|uniref:virulence factor n=1 Tax=Janthinobacterium sp. PAMC25594 TaxID=2861284 RepID=UPI001C63B675|nr:virulence factor [Janthinobacterium sp. PAMC25594]QYG05249.1 virulence factor [Janthinobacterium sp. PAMC25594]
MRNLIATFPRRLGWSMCVFSLASGIALWSVLQTGPTDVPLEGGLLMKRLLLMPALLALAVLFLTSASASKAPVAIPIAAVAPIAQEQPYMAQVVGVQWLNPLQRRDYPTEWQLLWTLGLAKPNKDDSKVKENPVRFGKVQSIGMIASGNKGRETFNGYHEKYVEELITLFHDIYFSNEEYFYNAHSLTNKSTRRELAGIRVEYALPAGRLDPVEVAEYLREEIVDTFSIGNPSFPDSWTTATPPDVRVTMGGANAGFTSLAAGMAYLQANPDKTVWVMNWDAPSYPPKDEQINENMVLLVLAGPGYKTDRAPLAWLGFPATRKVADFTADKGASPRVVQAWSHAIDAAARNAQLNDDAIGYVIHDAGSTYPVSSERLGPLAQSLTQQLPDFDFNKQTFNMPALLGETGAGTALTNVALAIGYANHVGRPVLVAGSSDSESVTAVVVAPPAVVRPVDHEQPWFRARGGNTVFLPWWGRRFDARPGSQGYSR